MTRFISETSPPCSLHHSVPRQMMLHMRSTVLRSHKVELLMLTTQTKPSYTHIAPSTNQICYAKNRKVNDIKIWNRVHDHVNA